MSFRKQSWLIYDIVLNRPDRIKQHKAFLDSFYDEFRKPRNKNSIHRILFKHMSKRAARILENYIVCLHFIKDYHNATPLCLLESRKVHVYLYRGG